MKRPLQIALLSACAVALSAFAVQAANVYEGPAGEIYIGDYLPARLQEKGYLPKGAPRPTDRNSSVETVPKKEPTRYKKIPVEERPSVGAAGGVAGASREPVIRLAFPDENWALELPGRGFDVKAFDLVADGAASTIYAENREAGVLMSARVERPAKRVHGASECRRRLFDEAAAARPVKRDELRRSERDSTAFVEYMVKEESGVRIDQWNVHAFIAIKGACASVRLSKVFYSKSDSRLFRALIDSVRIDRGRGYYGSDYLLYGTELLAMRKYEAAAAFLEKAASEAEPDRALAAERLSIAYSLSGRAAKAKEACRRAISSDPANPFLYYALARLYAAEGDATGAAVNVRMALERRKNAAKGRVLPDPASDPAFSRVASDGEFKSALKGGGR